MKKTVLLLAILSFIGAGCWAMQLLQGAQLTNLNNFMPWGIYIVGYVVFTGVAAGSLILTGSAWIFDALQSYRPYTRITSFVGILCALVAAGLFVMVDMGGPIRGVYMLISPNFSSPQVWDAAILAIYAILGMLLLRKLPKNSFGTKNDMSLLAWSSIIAGFLVVITSFAFALQVSAPLWNNPAEPISFFVAALIVSLAVLILSLGYLHNIDYIRLNQGLLKTMGNIVALLLLVEGILTFGEVCIGLYAPNSEEGTITSWLVFGKGTVFFWLEVLFLIAGIFLLGRNSEDSVPFRLGAWSSILAVFLVKYNLLQAQQLNPLLSFAGSSAYQPLELGAYFPSLTEIGTFIGIVSIASLFCVVGLEKFRHFFTLND